MYFSPKTAIIIPLWKVRRDTLANNEWANWGRSIQELIDKAVNSQDYQELSRNIGKTIDKAFSASSEAVRRAANSAPKNSAYHYNYTTPKVTVEPKKETLPALYGNPNGETTKGILQTVFGGILAVAALGLVIPFGVLSIVGSAGFVVGFLAGGAALVGGTALLCSGIGTLAKVSRFKVYLKALGTKTSITLERLSRSVGKNERFVRKELQKMIKQGLFLEGHLDNEQKNLITSDETFQEFERSRLELEQRKRSQAVQAAKAPDPKIQEVLDKGNAYVKEIRRCNDEIPGEEISAKIDRMEAIVRKIFERAEAHPEVIPDMKKLMDYYLPMTVKLLNAYADMDRQPVQGETIRKSKQEIDATLDTLNAAFEKLLDELFQDAAIDVSSDISVLNTLLAQEGLTGSDFDLK